MPVLGLGLVGWATAPTDAVLSGLFGVHSGHGDGAGPGGLLHGSVNIPYGPLARNYASLSRRQLQVSIPIRLHPMC